MSKSKHVYVVAGSRAAWQVGARGLAMLVLYGALAACDAGASRHAAGRVVASEWGDAQPAAKTIGFVLAGYEGLFHETQDGKEECPDGLAYSSRDNWEVQFPTKAERQAHLEKCSLVDNRGPDCASVYAVPDLIKDPLPFREVKGLKSYGLNLDGTEDGRETAGTCAHREFTGLDGKKGIDNQYYRLLGCHRGLRGLGAAISKAARVSPQEMRVLLEIRDVDDMRSDERVEVVVYRGKDPLVVDADAVALPWQTQRVDERIPPLRLAGQIAEGVLITDQIDAPRSHGVPAFGDSVPLRGMRFQLQLTETGAEGVRAGYIDIDQLWEARRPAATAFFGDSLPSLYAAMHRLADGYKDSKTGACTGLSSATGMTFVRAHIRHAEKQT